MMSLLSSLFVKLLSFFAPLYLSFKVGTEKTKRKHAEEIAKEKTDDAEIASKQYVDRPFSKLRNRSKK